MNTLRYLIWKAKLKQVDVSRITGITENRLSQLVTGRRVPSEDEIPMLAKALGVTEKTIRSLERE